MKQSRTLGSPRGSLECPGLTGILCHHDSEGIASVATREGSNYHPRLFQMAYRSE